MLAHSYFQCCVLTGIVWKVETSFTESYSYETVCTKCSNCECYTKVWISFNSLLTRSLFNFMKSSVSVFKKPDLQGSCTLLNFPSQKCPKYATIKCPKMCFEKNFSKNASQLKASQINVQNLKFVEIVIVYIIASYSIRYLVLK